MTEIPKPSHADAAHVLWGFRKEALIWDDDRPVALNLQPLAGDLRKWLLRSGELPAFTDRSQTQPRACTNPYTYHSSALATCLAAIINDSHEIATRTDAVNDLDVEVARVRIYSEIVLYVARICEALTKQLLFCTQIPSAYYDGATLGRLLSTECRECKSAGTRRHKLSLLGSLAHRYHLCHTFDGCLAEHVKLVARRRNVEAAHSAAPLLIVRTAAESRAQLTTDVLAVANEFIHMLQHLSEIEASMIREIEMAVDRGMVSGLAGTVDIRFLVQ